jgi:hypothetical protein
MTDVQKPATSDNWLEEPPKRTDTLNVITILTFIGCAIIIYFQFREFFRAQSTYDQIVQNQDKIEQLPAIVKKIMGPDPIGKARKTLENRTPMLILGVVAAALCVYGAVLMRQLKKIGFPIYVIGELLPLLAYYIFIGQMSMLILIFSLLINGIFILLYAGQLKHMS